MQLLWRLIAERAQGFSPDGGITTMSLLSSDSYHCFACGAEYSFVERVGRRDTCTKCDSDLHVCRNCRHFNPKAHNECDETQAEWVREKSRANYCEYFEPRRGAQGSPDVEQGKENARTRFEDLFKK
jgi:hypothetical protein